MALGWTIFEIAINCFQGLLILHYVKRCFPYSQPNRVADGLLYISCVAFLTSYLIYDYSFAAQHVLFLFPLIYVLVLSSEPKISAIYWLLILSLVFDLISAIMYPVFDLLPILLNVTYASLHLKRAMCIVTTNIILPITLFLIVRLKRTFTYPRTSAYAMFISILFVILLIEESLCRLYFDLKEIMTLSSFVSNTCFPLFLSYIGLLICSVLSILLFHMVSSDSERENRYQAEISLMNLSKQHQAELSHMYKELTEREHDYKHHLQVLKELVESNGETIAEKYLSAMSEENQDDRLFVTGSPVVDALLTAKHKLMCEKGIDFLYSPYPLAELPVSTSDFCSIVGNLLDNAIEGVQRIPEPREKTTIHLSFSRSWDMFYIYCENPCNPDTIVRTKDAFVSSKQKTEPGLHGIGLHSIETLATKAEGRTEFAVQNQTFYAKVVLPYLYDKEGTLPCCNGSRQKS